MANQNDSNYVSVKSWMWILFITAIPIIGQIMILIWAFAGENESRKNYFRAIILWFLILIGVALAIAAIGAWPELQRELGRWRSGR